MVNPIDDDMDNQMLLTISDIQASDQIRTESTIERSWQHRLFRHFPELVNRVKNIQVDWPGRLPNTVIVILNNKQRYRYTSDPGYDHGLLERI